MHQPNYSLLSNSLKKIMKDVYDGMCTGVFFFFYHRVIYNIEMLTL